MRIFQKSSRSFGDATELATKMGGQMPKPLIDSLLEQFTETPHGASKSVRPSATLLLTRHVYNRQLTVAPLPPLSDL